MSEPIKLIPFLEKVVQRNTKSHRQDFFTDAQKLRDAIGHGQQDERVFYFMSRPSGTWCVLERDVFLRDSDGYKIWTHYADMPDGIEAYRIAITGHQGTDIPLGRVVKLNYREQVQRVIKNALPFHDVELTFCSGEKITIDYERYRKSREEIFFDYGVIQNFRYCAVDEAALCRTIMMEHRNQKGWRPKEKKVPKQEVR